MFGKKAQPKEEHRMQEEWDQMEPNEKPSYVSPQGGDAILPVSPYTGMPYDPEWACFPVRYRSPVIPPDSKDQK